MPFGKYKGKTLPQVLFEDPQYLIWLYEQDVLFKGLKADQYEFGRKLAHQLEVLHNRACNILPPEGREFCIIIDAEEVFEGFVEVSKGRFPKKRFRLGSKVDQRLSLLNINVPKQYRNPSQGFSRLSRCLRRHFFNNQPDELSAKACATVLMDNAAFDLSEVSSHKRLKPTARDHKLLRHKYLESVRRQ